MVKRDEKKPKAAPVEEPETEEAPKQEGATATPVAPAEEPKAAPAVDESLLTRRQRRRLRFGH